MAARRSFGVLMYCRKAALCQRPNVCIVESSIPRLAAVVAAPILKLWPAKLCWGRPMEVKISRIRATKRGLVMIE